MGGGLMQLVAYGAQDIYLTGNPQITFFKVVYRRHTNFAMEAIAQTFDGQVSSGCTVSATISRNGDLVHRVYLEVDNSNDVMNAFALVDQVDLEIGGQLIDRHYGKWMAVWCELTHSTSKHEQLDMLIDADKGTLGDDNDAGAQNRVWIPLQFSFCRNPGLAIPLIALQYHEVKINVKFGTLPANANVCMWCDYIYLDTDERRRFAQTSHEYLIEQVQSSLSNCTTPGCVQKVTLHFNHPVKELVWMEDNGSWASNSRGLWTTDKPNTNMLLRLNGHERFTARDSSYFSKVQRYQHHTGAHAVPLPDTGVKHNHLFVYSFALQPEEHQPSGTCNFSRIDNAVLELTGDCDIYAVNYNVLRVMSGMGGLAYSN